jgi:hypothetical protein
VREAQVISIAARVIYASARCVQPLGKSIAAQIFSDESSTSIYLFDIIFGSPSQNMAAAAESFDMAGEKFNMPCGPRALLAHRLLLVNLQPAQTASAMRNYCEKR